MTWLITGTFLGALLFWGKNKMWDVLLHKGVDDLNSPLVWNKKHKRLERPKKYIPRKMLRYIVVGKWVTIEDWIEDSTVLLFGKDLILGAIGLKALAIGGESMMLVAASTIYGTLCVWSVTHRYRQAEKRANHGLIPA